MQVYYISRVVNGALIAALAAAVWFSARLAWADARFHERTLEGVARAIEILPDNTEYLLFHALQLDYEGQNSTVLLERAAFLSPRSSTPRIRLGLAAESRGDAAGAERWLLDAARVDRQFEPRWTLANFFFRQTRRDEFWEWMKRALEVSYGDRRAAFDLCWRMTSDAGEVLARGIPDGHQVIAAYLVYVSETHPEEAAASAAARLAAFHDPADRPLLEAAVDTLIAKGRGGEAGALWRLLGRGDPLTGAAGIFAEGSGFAWHRLSTGGVVHGPAHEPDVHRITLSGKQPEVCDLLARTLLLTPGKRYVLRWSSRVESAQRGDGFAWRIGDHRFAFTPSPQWKAQEAVLTAPADLATLTLVYQRPPGAPRLEGSMELRDVVIAAHPDGTPLANALPGAAISSPR